MQLSFDIGEEGGRSESPALQRFRTMAEDAISMEKLVEDLEENLSEVKKRLNRLKTIDLPDLMAECGMSEFKSETGFKITIDDFVSGSLPKEDDKRSAAINWLETNGAAAIIKSELQMVFEKSQHNEALSVKADLENKGYAVAAKMGVHPQTLIAHVKERLRNGDEIPLDVLGLYAGRVAKIKAPKSK